MQYIYVAGKYSADNIDDRDYYVEQINEVAKQLFENGYIPVVPVRITYDWENDDRFRNLSPDEWLDRFCIPLLSLCDALVVATEEESYGVNREIEYAQAVNIPVFRSLEEFLNA